MNAPRKPPTKLEQREGESPWEAMARELATNPDSPASLKIMSIVGQALAPAQAAVEQLIESLAVDLDQSTEQTREAVSAATAYWEKVTRQVISPRMRAEFETDARARVERRRNRPPDLHSIIPDASGRTDIGYEQSLHLEGLHGTWHRLWASIAFDFAFPTADGESRAVEEIRRQFEEQLGREMTEQEWAQLSAHAKNHYERVLKPKLGDDPT